MADNLTGDLFKTAKKGGYDREDVERQFQAVKASASMEKDALLSQIAEKDREITSLNDTVRGQREEIDGLHKDISEKYQSYIDYYDTIGEVILDSRIQAKKIVEDAYSERDRILANVNEEAKRAAEEARTAALADALREKEEIERANEEKRAQYNAMCEKIAALVGQLEAADADFSAAVKNVRDIADGNPPEKGPEEEAAEDLDLADTHEIEFQGFSEEE